MIGENIRKKRIEADMTQTELARRLNVCKQTVSAWEMNRNDISLEMIDKVAGVLNCSRMELIENDGKYFNSDITVQNQEEQILLEAFRSATQEQRYQVLLHLLKKG